MAADRAWLKRGSWPANLRHVICQSLLSLWRSSTISSSATTKHDKPFTSLAEIKPRTNPKTPVKMARIPSLISNSFVGFSAIKQKGNSVAKRTAELETWLAPRIDAASLFPHLGHDVIWNRKEKGRRNQVTFLVTAGSGGGRKEAEEEGGIRQEKKNLPETRPVWFNICESSDAFIDQCRQKQPGNQ